MVIIIITIIITITRDDNNKENNDISDNDNINHTNDNADDDTIMKLYLPESRNITSHVFSYTIITIQLCLVMSALICISSGHVNCKAVLVTAF